MNLIKCGASQLIALILSDHLAEINRVSFFGTTPTFYSPSEVQSYKHVLKRDNDKVLQRGWVLK